jgi:hypothetical protein
MSIYIIPFLLVTALLVLFTYAWLQCRAEQQQDREAAPATPHRAFSLRLTLEYEWTTDEWGRRQILLTINHRQLVVEFGGAFGNLLRIQHRRQCVCGGWKAPDTFVLSVWGYEACIDCAERHAYDFFEVNEHYGRPNDMPASCAWIPEALVQVYDEHARNVVW